MYAHVIFKDCSRNIAHTTMSESTNKRASFTEGPLWKHVFRLSGFMVMGFLAMTIALLIEAIYLGMVGSDELAAIAFAFPVVMGFNALTRGIGIGTSAVLARTIGAGMREQAARIATHGLLLTLGFTVLCAALLAVWSEEIFHLMGARDHILDLVVSYMVIWCIGYPSFGLSMVGSGMMRSIGDPAFPGYVLTVGSVLQIFIAPPLIFGWFGITAMGIEGAGWSFVFARISSLLLTAWWFLIREKMIRWSLENFGNSVRTILHVAIPAGMSNLIQPASMGIITWLLASYGTLVVAGFGVAGRIEAVVNMVVIGISASAAPLVGQNWGAKLYDRVDEALKLTYQFCLVWGLFAALIMWLGGEFFAGLISRDPKVIEVASIYLLIVPISIGFSGLINVANGSFNALGKPGPPLVLAISRLLIVYVPLAIIASRLFGYEAIFYVTAFVNILFGIISWHWNRTAVHTLRPFEVI